MDVNFFGVAYGYRAALPALKESRGTFLHVSSALAYRGIPLQAAYCSSKAAARAFLESARVELQKHGHDVAISLVLPGAINTPQFDRDRTVGQLPGEHLFGLPQRLSHHGGHRGRLAALCHRGG